MKTLWKKWWFREVISVLFKLHPIILLLLGKLDRSETFMTLVVSYLVMALFTLVRSTYTFGYHYVVCSIPTLPSIGKKIEMGIGYFLGWLFIVILYSFLILLFFYTMYNAIERSDPETSIFSGASGSVLIRTLLINGIYFSVVEALKFRHFVRAFSPTNHPLMSTLSFGINTEVRNKWSAFHVAWLLIFFAFFIFMCTGFAFVVAIYAFFIFDIGYIFLRRLDDSKNNKTVSSV